MAGAVLRVANSYGWQRITALEATSEAAGGGIRDGLKDGRGAGRADGWYWDGVRRVGGPGGMRMGGTGGTSATTTMSEHSGAGLGGLRGPSHLWGVSATTRSTLGLFGLRQPKRRRVIHGEPAHLHSWTVDYGPPCPFYVVEGGWDEVGGLGGRNSLW